MFWVTLGVSVVTAAATAINYLLFRTQVDPNVVVFAETDQRNGSIINLVIENIGKGVAKNVRFTCSEPLPARAFGFANAATAPRMVDGPLITGIPSLGPGSRRVIQWGQFGGLSKAIGDRAIQIVATYNSDAKSPWDPRQIVTESLVDVKSFETTALSQNYQKLSADALEKIASQLSDFAHGYRKLQVDVSLPATEDSSTPAEQD